MNKLILLVLIGFHTQLFSQNKTTRKEKQSKIENLQTAPSKQEQGRNLVGKENAVLQAKGNQVIETIKVFPEGKEIEGKKQTPVNSEINWTNNSVKSEGVAYLNKDHVAKNDRQYAIDMAIIAAEGMGRRALLATLKEVRIVDTLYIKDSEFLKQISIHTLEGSIRAERIGEPIIENDRVKVFMAFSMDTPNFQKNVTGRIGTRQTEPSEQMIEEAKNEGIDVASIIPKDKEFIVNAEDTKKFNPSLFNKIRVVDEDGKTIWTNFTSGIKVKDEKLGEIIDLTIKVAQKSGTFDKAPVNIDADGSLIIKAKDILSEENYKKLTRAGKLADWMPIILSAVKIGLNFI